MATETNNQPQQPTPEQELKQLKIMYSVVQQQRNEAQNVVANLNSVVVLLQENLEQAAQRINELTAKLVEAQPAKKD